MTGMTVVASGPTPLKVMGLGVAPFESYDHALAAIGETVASRRKAFWVAINPQKVQAARHDPRLMETLARCDVGICDGVGVALAARWLLGRRVRRITGCDLFFRVIQAAAASGWKVFLLGASPASNGGAARQLEARYPGLRIVGRQDGYFKDADTVVRDINASGADILLVAMGSPRQEFWISQHRDRIEAPFCMGVGGSFDVASGRAKRAPSIFRRTGTEFLFRLVCEPQRIRRQLALPAFVLSMIRAKFSSNGV